MCAQDRARNLENPRRGPAPTGYSRLHQGTTPWDRAEALTQLTGQPAMVREFPHGRDEWAINRIIRAQLSDGKPVLVSSRPQAHKREVLPHDLKPAHVYEVTGIEQGKILLRNPWNQAHPQPMETEEFARNMNRSYSTLICGPLMPVGTQVHVGDGTVAHREGLSFGGSHMLAAGDGEPAEVIVAVWRQGTDSVRFRLSLGQTFEFSGQTWRLDEIDDRSHRWYATLTRVA